MPNETREAGIRDLFREIDCVSCGSSPDLHRTLIRATVRHKGEFFGLPLRIVVCPDCALVFQQPQPRPEPLGRFYEKQYYRESPAEGPSADALFKKDVMYEWLSTHLAEAGHRWRILDVGAGFGEWLGRFRGRHELLAIEQSEQAARFAKENYGVETRQIDFLDNDLEPEQFDLVTGLAIIEHFLDPFEAIVTANSLLKPGGHLLLQTPDVHGAVLRLGVDRFFKIVHTFYFSRATLSDLFERAGFEIVAARERPPVYEGSSFLHPGNYLDGQLEILGRKTIHRTVAEARAIPPSRKESPAEVFRSLRRIRRRDRAYLLLEDLRRRRGIGPFVGRIQRWGRRLLGPVPRRDRNELLRERLRAPDAHRGG